MRRKSLKEILSEDILERYNNIEYWDPAVIREYLDEQTEVTQEDMDIATMMLDKIEIDVAEIKRKLKEK